jgi:hypothetical protein
VFEKGLNPGAINTWRLPTVASRPETFAAPSSRRWEWAVGIFVLILLVALLSGYSRRKQTGP